MQAESDRQSRSDARTVVGFLISAVAIAGCVWWAAGQERPRFPQGTAAIALLLFGLMLYAVATVIRGWRWDKILSFLEVKHERVDAYALTTVGYMGNTVLPARGGELLRVFLMSERSEAGRREVLGTIISERLLDLAALAAFFILVATTGLGEAPGGSVTTMIAALLLAVMVGGGFAYLRLREAGRFERFADRVRPFVRASRQLLTIRGAHLFAVTALVWVLEAIIFTFCARSLDVELTVLDGLVVTVISALSALIPAGPGYVGTYDAAALFALSRIDVTGGDAVSCVLLFRFVAFVPITIVGLVVMVVRYGGLRGALRRERDAERSDQDLSPERS